MNNSLRNFLDLIFVLLAGCGLAGCGENPTARDETAPTPRPNIIFIFADDLGYGDLGSYGNQTTLAPHLDQLATDGIRLTNFYVTAPVCTPSRSGLLTGRYPRRNGLYEMIRNDMVNYGHKYTEREYARSPEMTLGMDLREVTVGQVLNQADYATGIVGKWDGGRARRFLPLQRGFDFYYGFANTGIDYYTHERYGIPSMFHGNERVKEEGYATNLFGHEAVRFIREKRDRPFFLYVSFNAPHSASNLRRDSRQAPDQVLARYEGDPKENSVRYQAMITSMDDAVGEILLTLDEDELGLRENTLVVFSSDNGGRKRVASNSPLRGGKGNLYEGGVRVPFLARWPGKIAPGTVSDEFTSTLELLPTFAAIAGTKPQRGGSIILDGFDMTRLLTEGAASERESMFWDWRGQRGARVGDWKWMDSPQEGEGLFNLTKDIGEKNDLSKKEPQRLADLKAKWEAWMEEMNAAEPRGPFRNY